MTPIVQRNVRWYCPNCPLEETSVEPAREIGGCAARFHTCKGLRGLLAPMLQAGVKAKVFAVERGDYVGKEHVQLDAGGRPVMSVVTVRDDGQDCIAFAPLAVVGAEV